MDATQIARAIAELLEDRDDIAEASVDPNVEVNGTAAGEIVTQGGAHYVFVVSPGVS